MKVDLTKKALLEKNPLHIATVDLANSLFKTEKITPKSAIIVNISHIEEIK